VGDQANVSNEWLRQYAVDLREGRVQPQGWSDLLQRQRQTAVSGGKDPTEIATQLLQLVWITAERAIRDGLPEVAQEIVNENVELIPPRIDDLVKATSWALDHSLHPCVIKMHDTYRDRYEESPVLLYSAAEAFSREGDVSIADGLATQALAINPLPKLNAQAKPGSKSEEPGELIHPQIIRVHAEAHVKIAMELAHRGLFRWAEKEYELVIGRLPIDHTISAYARLQSATMHGELQDHAAVVRALTPLAKRISQDDEFEERLIAVNFTPAMVQSDLQFHRGLMMAKQGKLDEAREDLKKAFEDYKNIDILIAMYRLDGDDQWKETVDELLQQQIRLAEIDVDEANNSLQRIGPFRLSNHQVAKRLNAYAWLVSNTEGNYKKALRYSLQSLQKTPNQAALMDTAARCYFAVGDFESAVKMQAEACRKMPHSPPLQRQLDQFRKAWKSESTNDSKPSE
jgi:tetratricopeptide (TPR) repeat protein